MKDIIFNTEKNERFKNKNDGISIIVKCLLIFTFILLVISVCSDFKKINKQLDQQRSHGIFDDEKPDNVIIVI